MRIISGSARGRKLKGPPSHATRPMSDKIRGAVFNSVASLGVEPTRVLDLYAGTGAIGIEALSRGAEHADFVDMGKDQVAVIRDNIRSTGFERQGHVHQMPVERFIERFAKPYDFIVMDPPYADPKIIPTLEMLETSKLVQSGTIIVLGHSPRVEPPDQIGHLEALRHRCHGDTCFSIYEYVDGDTTAGVDDNEADGDEDGPTG
jgi:16S rRNA (guanine966-N2)-methyltransferase